jgi:hypothetical protein
MHIRPGKNIAVKVPLYRWAETVSYYRDRVGLKITQQSSETVAFAFGEFTLWIDRVEKQSQVDVWLELFTDDPDSALAHLGGPMRAELEPLNEVDGYWTSDPAGVVLLVRKE